jgi:hypothetical protein
MVKSRSSRRPKKAARKASRRPADRLRAVLAGAVRGLASAEQDMAKQVGALLKRKGVNVKDASRLLGQWRARADRQRRAALSALDTRMTAVQARIRKESKSAGRALHDGVHSALAALDIPSRREIGELTRKVDALSRKLDRKR